MESKFKLVIRIIGFIFYVVTTFLIILLLWGNYDHHKQVSVTYASTIDKYTRIANEASQKAAQNQKLILQVLQEMDLDRKLENDAGSERLSELKHIRTLLEERFKDHK